MNSHLTFSQPERGLALLAGLKENALSTPIAARARATKDRPLNHRLCNFNIGLVFLSSH